MRLILLLSLSLFLVLAGQAQVRVRNVRIQVVDSAQLEIRYDLVNAQPEDSVYFEMRSRLRGALRIRPEFVRGDIGVGITAAPDRRIIWDALANGYSLKEEVQAKVFVKTGAVPAPPKPIVTEPVVVQKPIVTTPKPEPVPPKPAATEPVAVTEPKPKSTEPVSTTSTPSRRRRATRTKPSVFAADSTQPQAAPAVVSTSAPQQKAPVVVSTPIPQQPTSQTAPVVQPTETNPVAVAVDSVRPRKTRYVGPAWALLSAVAPGIGNIFVQMPKPRVGLRPLLTVGCYGLIAYGLTERQKSRDEYAIYEVQKNATAGEPYYQTANDHYHRYFMATRGAMVVAAADVILTFIKGLRNNQLQKEARRVQGVTLRPGIQGWSTNGCCAVFVLNRISITHYSMRLFLTSSFIALFLVNSFAQSTGRRTKLVVYSASSEWQKVILKSTTRLATNQPVSSQATPVQQPIMKPTDRVDRLEPTPARPIPPSNSDFRPAFTGDFATNRNGWKAGNQGDYHYQIGVGRYSIRKRNTNTKQMAFSTVELPADINLNNADIFTIKVDMLADSGQVPAGGVLFGVKDSLNYCAFSMNGKGEVSIIRVANGRTFSDYMPGDFFAPGVSIERNRNRLLIQRKGEALHFYINAQEIRSSPYPFKMLSGNGIGLTSSAYWTSFQKLIVTLGL